MPLLQWRGISQVLCFQTTYTSHCKSVGQVLCSSHLRLWIPNLLCLRIKTCKSQISRYYFYTASNSISGRAIHRDRLYNTAIIHPFIHISGRKFSVKSVHSILLLFKSYGAEYPALEGSANRDQHQSEYLSPTCKHKYTCRCIYPS